MEFITRALRDSIDKQPWIFILMTWIPILVCLVIAGLFYPVFVVWDFYGNSIRKWLKAS